jgi:hypothetical protein
MLLSLGVVGGGFQGARASTSVGRPVIRAADYAGLEDEAKGMWGEVPRWLLMDGGCSVF